jgi:hypothetical protein
VLYLDVLKRRDAARSFVACDRHADDADDADAVERACAATAMAALARYVMTVLYDRSI